MCVFDEGSHNVTRGVGWGGVEWYHKLCQVTERLKLNKTTMFMIIYSRVANPHFIPGITIYCGPSMNYLR